ncbi:HNH endonuclease [Paenibacillus artemisiicola]|nr:HNH endonuclease [Paenibacillus artemisiicola]
MQNKTLNESRTNGVNVYLFEVFREKEYTYRGRVELVDSPYTEEQLDSDKSLRTVWIFPVKLKDEALRFYPSTEILDEVKVHQDKQARRLSSDELRERALHSRKSSTMMQNTVNVFYRDPYVSEYAKRRANGHCQLCGDVAPFHNKKGEPFLETHHVKWLSRGGEDTVENTVALCPNCHRKMHALDLQTDVQKLLQVAGGWLV